MTEDLRNDLTSVLKFYQSLGFESIPFATFVNNSFVLDMRSAYTFVDAAHSQSINIAADEPATHDRSEDLQLLRKEIGDCKRCRLSEGRNNIVFGEGNINTSVMFIGEAPGRDEDLQGRPFVGQAGQILTSLINNMGKELGFGREDVYIANIVKCRPPMNRDPMPDEIESCISFLNRQIEIISPQVIISLGRISAHTLMGLKTPLSKFSISEARGKFFEYRTKHLAIPVMPTFHPAYFLRNKKDKHLTWSDVMAVIDKLKYVRHK